MHDISLHELLYREIVSHRAAAIQQATSSVFSRNPYVFWYETNSFTKTIGDCAQYFAQLFLKSDIYTPAPYINGNVNPSSLP